MRSCRVCSDPLVEGSYYIGNSTICKGCFIIESKVARQKRKRQLEILPDDMDLGIVESLEPDSMYVMQNSRIPDEFKVGRSHNPAARAKDLSSCQNFWVQLLHVYQGYGHLEATVHQRLKTRRVKACAGTEWFRVDLAIIQTIIDGVIAEHQLREVSPPDYEQSSYSTADQDDQG